MIDDPYLNYFALGILIFVVVVLFYGVIAIHDIPHIIAKSRNHPHQDAIHAAGWVSLFTLHALWPFLWIWAMAYRPERGWGFAKAPNADLAEELAELHRRVAGLESQSEPKKPDFGSPATLSPNLKSEDMTKVGGR
jgi:hypothetical protein